MKYNVLLIKGENMIANIQIIKNMCFGAEIKNRLLGKINDKSTKEELIVAVREHDECFASCSECASDPYIKVPSATSCGYETATLGDSINLSVPNSKTRRGRVGKQVAQTLDTQCNQAVYNERIRKLTPLECWRLQDFPDAALHKAKEAGLSDSQLYKQAGNSMSVNVLELLIAEVKRHIK